MDQYPKPRGWGTWGTATQVIKSNLVYHQTRALEFEACCEPSARSAWKALGLQKAPPVLSSPALVVLPRVAKVPILKLTSGQCWWMKYETREVSQTPWTWANISQMSMVHPHTQTQLGRIMLFPSITSKAVPEEAHLSKTSMTSWSTAMAPGWYRPCLTPPDPT